MTSHGTLLRNEAGSPPAASRLPMPTPAAACPHSASHAVLLLVRWRTAALAWGWSRLVRGPGALKGTPGLRGAHVLGSGRGGGFGLVPSAHCQGLIAFFDTEAGAALFAADSSPVRAYEAHAQELMSLVLRTTACRGSWAGQGLVGTGPPPPGAPVAALTRAAIRPSRAMAFWQHAAPTQAGVQTAAGCRLAAGLGEAPLLRQCTFSVWDNEAALARYAQQGAHREAAANAWRQDWFSESMFARFEVLHAQGRWQGRSLDLGAVSTSHG
jgi:hypothetical protein